MTYKSNAVLVCDQCGKTVPFGDGDSPLAAFGWYELHQQQQEQDDGKWLPWLSSEDLGDFCSLACLRAWVEKQEKA